MLACFLHAVSGLDREVCRRESFVVFGNFSLRDFFTSERCAFHNFGSTDRLHYFSAIHKMRAHASYMGVIANKR